MKIQQFILIALFFTFLFSCEKEWNEIAISSPDSKLQLIFNLKNGKPTYKLNLNGKPVIIESRMGFQLNDLPPLDSNFILINKKVSSVNKTRIYLQGEAKTIENKYNEVVLYLKESSNTERILNITFRLYNGGMGFRYELPVQENLNEFQITEELTELTFANEELAWYIPVYKKEGYENLYKKTKLSRIDTADTPLTIETKNGLFLCFHEAALYDFPRYALYASDTNTLAFDLGSLSNGIVYAKTPFSTPWRTIQVAQKPVDLITNYLILNLNDTCSNCDTSFYEPIIDYGSGRNIPNIMSRENAQGIEYNALIPNGGYMPDYIPTLVFTKLMAGPMGFAPGIFNLDIPTKSSNRLNATLARQLAHYVVIYNPVQMNADLPENFKDNPAFEFIKDVPCNWEETIALNGEIGNYVSIARKDRNSDDWYLGSVTDEEARNFKLRADFLDGKTKYFMKTYTDGKDADWLTHPLSIQIAQDTIENADTLFFNLAPGGGTAIKFVPIPKEK